MRLDNPLSGGPNSPRITHWAYESTPDVPIRVGVQCCSQPTSAPTAAIAEPTTLCPNQSAPFTLRAQGGSGAVLRWYANFPRGTPIGEGMTIQIAAPDTTTVYHARWESPGCTPSATASVTVVVADTLPPVIDHCPVGRALTFSSLPDLRSELVAHDNCTATINLSITQLPPPGTPISQPSAVMFEVRDQAGNMATCTATVTPPVPCGITRWVNATPTANSPGQISAAPMAYDAARQQVVLFGGANQTALNLSNTWLMTNGVWSQVSTTAPPAARRHHNMVFDSVNQQVVLFGGEGNSTSLNDTWTWNGAHWVNRTTAASPSARAHFGMSFDSRSGRGKVVIFGGYVVSSPTNETWEWSHATGNWQLITPVGDQPSSRADLAMAFDAHRGVSVLFGGRAANVPQGDTWEWNGTAWSQRANGSLPAPREGHRMVFDPNRQRIVMFGGTDANSARLNDAWEWNGDTGTWAPITVTGSSPPSARYNFGFAFDGSRNLTVLTGGLVEGGSSDETWTLQISNPCPPSRLYVRAAAPAGGNGQSWMTAFRSLQDALTAARQLGAGVREIWMARGIYKPATSDPTQLIAFEMVGNLALYGGFAGTESTLAEREANMRLALARPLDPDFATILSGDLAGNDVDEADVGAPRNREENSYHIIRVGAADNVRFDGLTVSGGGAGAEPAPDIPAGAAILNDQGKLITIANCTFQDNDSSDGGAIYSAAPVNPLDGPRIYNSVFRDNRVFARGGAILFTGRQRPVLANCVFSGNFSYGSGGPGGGGAIACVGGARVSASQCTFHGNWTQTGQGGALKFEPTSGANDSTPVLFTNSVVWGNGRGTSPGGSPTLAEQISGGPDTSWITRTCVQGLNFGGGENLGTDPFFIDDTGPATINGLGVRARDLRLDHPSACIDHGNRAGIPADTLDLDNDGDLTEPLPHDVLHAARFVDNPRLIDTGLGIAPHSDLGAYETFVIRCPAKMPGDPVLDADDLGDFINCYFALPPCPLADFDDDGTVNSDDLGDYINAFFGGC
ncbi:MAG: kelch repeat-containing protein [Phycisphaerales bacterium]